MIAVESIQKRFGPVLALDDVTLTLGRGEIVGLLGPNGAGKTTMMRILTGTLQPDAGSVTIDGRPIGDAPVEAKRRIGYLPENNPIYAEMLVAEYLEFAAALHGSTGRSAKPAIDRAVEETGIAEVFYRPVAELSKGYRQRVGLAGAILHRPDLLVLDEPTEGLDPNQRLEVRRLIGQLGQGRSLLISSHVLHEIEAVCTRLVIIHRGRIAADGPVTDLLAARQGRATYVVDAEGVGMEDALAALPGVISCAADHGDRPRVRLTAPAEVELRPLISGLARERGWVLWELYRERETLEDLFHSITTRAAAEPTPTPPIA